MKTNRKEWIYFSTKHVLKLTFLTKKTQNEQKYLTWEFYTHIYEHVHSYAPVHGVHTRKSLFFIPTSSGLSFYLSNSNSWQNTFFDPCLCIWPKFRFQEGNLSAWILVLVAVAIKKEWMLTATAPYFALNTNL